MQGFCIACPGLLFGNGRSKCVVFIMTNKLVHLLACMAFNSPLGSCNHIINFMNKNSILASCFDMLCHALSKGPREFIRKLAFVASVWVI